MNLNEMAREIHTNAVNHGFYPEGHERRFGELIALIHSELSEALEEYRSGQTPTETYYSQEKAGYDFSGVHAPCKPEGVPSELADVIIRVLDTCGYYGIDIQGMVEEKMAYNKTRPIRHGGKVI
jgi:NTP pyrophosphatase (non-canonical NTP hydrolase)